MDSLVDLNDALGKALLQQFFEPILTGRGPNGEAYYMPSGVSLMAAEMYKQQSKALLEMIWEKIDIEGLASKISDLVVADLLKPPTTYTRNIPQEKLKERVLEIVAQQLGQRVVDNMGVRLEPKEIESNG